MNFSNPSRSILPLWKSLSVCALGKQIFSYAIRFINPYSGTLGASVEVLEKCHCETLLKDKKKNRNHLDSIHAIALANLGELTSGLAVLSSIGQQQRGIVSYLSVEYFKKARGTLRGICTFDMEDISNENSCEVYTEILNSDNETVCIVKVKWKLGKSL